MPFNPINFANIEPQGNPALRDFISNIMTGYQAAQIPSQLARQAEKEKLANAMQSLLLQQQPQKFGEESQGRQLENALSRYKLQEEPERFRSTMSTASLGRALNQAHIDKLRQEMSLPFGGKTPPGSIGQAIWLSQIKQHYGEGSQEYKDAKTAFQSDLEKAHSLIDYRGALTSTMDKRSSTNLTKLALEKADIEEGYQPGTNRTVRLMPDEQTKLAGQYDLKMQKEVSDLDSRKRSLFAANIDKTLANINVDDLTQYAGAKGGISKLSEQSKAPFGKESQNYRNFQKSLAGAKLLAKQIRQFYGDSIQPEMQAHIQEMVNPASWTNNPELAKQNFNTVKNILNQETGTYRGAIKSTKEFESKSPSSENIEQEESIDGRPVVKINGKWHYK